MIRDIRCTYMSNGVVDIRWKDGRIRLNAVIRKEEMELFKVAFDYYLYETPFHASGTDQVEVWFQESNFKQQLAGHLKMDVEDEVFTRVYEQIQRAILKISKEGVTEMTIEEELGLPPQRSDINVLLAARTGAGKSTIIKSCSAVPDDVNFPVVSSNRTTTFPTEFVLTHDQTYEVKILFQERSWVDQRVQEAISSAVLKYAEHVLLYHLEDAETCKYETVEAFLNADEQNLFLIKLILGRYKKDARTELEAEHNQYWSEFYDKIAALGDQFVESFAVESGTPELSLERIAEKVKWMMVVKRKTPISLNSDLVQEVVHDIYQRVQAILRMADIIAFESATDQQVEEQPNGVVVHNEGAEEILVGYCKKLPTVNPWELLRLFFSRDSSDTGRSVTPLIKRAKVTLPYHESLEKVGVTISLHDIVGFGHSNSDSDSSSLEGSTNLDYSQYDVLAVVERSDDAMNDVTRKILKNVLENAQKKKIMLCYSHYHKLNKDDWAEETYEKEREDELLKLQRQTLNNLGTDSASIRDLVENRTMFLRYHVLENKKERKIQDRHYVSKFLEMARRIAYEVDEVKQQSSIAPVYDYQKLAVVYYEARKDFLHSQGEIYCTNPPHYKTTEALTKRLAQGETFFQGTRKILKPLDDFHTCVMKHLNVFLLSPHPESDAIDSFAIDVIKEKVAQDLKKDIKSAFLSPKIIKGSPESYVWNNEWEKAYGGYQGSGTDKKRRNKIMEIFDHLLPPLAFNTALASDFWIKLMERHIRTSIADISESQKQGQGV